MIKSQPEEVINKSQKREIAAGRAEMLNCANCGVSVYHGAMNLLALAISRHKPVCGYECNKALGQID